MTSVFIFVIVYSESLRQKMRINEQIFYEGANWGILPWCPLHIVISVIVPPSHQRDKKYVGKSHFCLQNFVAFINIDIISLNC